MKSTTFIILFLFWNSIYSQFTFPDESLEHEGTWLAWPHDYTYNSGKRQYSEQVWIDMTKALVQGEKVHIVAYNQSELNHIEQTLTQEGVNMNQIDFYIAATDDYWMRDMGAIFVFDSDSNLHVADWGFNGWGNDAPFSFDDQLASNIANQININTLDLSTMVFEGGSIEHNQAGDALLCRSSVTNSNRNPNLTEQEIENYLTSYYGINHFLWLDGTPGLEITDFHIDGFAKFLNDSTIITLDSIDLDEWGVSEIDIDRLLNFKDQNNDNYNYLILPLTQTNVQNYWGEDLGYKGSYANFYIANSCVLVPTYNDSNDDIAISILQSHYPNREVIGIDVTRIYEYGGMIHCITQQQPYSDKFLAINYSNYESIRTIFPNPTHETLHLNNTELGNLVIYNSTGKIVLQKSIQAFEKITISNLCKGIYTVSFTTNNTSFSQPLIIE